jgi:hypothetical protein
LANQRHRHCQFWHARKPVKGLLHHVAHRIKQVETIAGRGATATQGLYIGVSLMRFNILLLSFF